MKNVFELEVRLGQVSPRPHEGGIAMELLLGVRFVKFGLCCVHHETQKN